MIKIIFWNAERLSANAEAIAQSAEASAGAAAESKESFEQRTTLSKPMTRYGERMYEEFKVAKAAARSGAASAAAAGAGAGTGARARAAAGAGAGAGGGRFLSAAAAAAYKPSRNEIKRYEMARIARTYQEMAKRKANKHKFSRELIGSAHYVFYCEVLTNHPDHRSSLLGAAPAGTLCYAHYQNKVSAPFTACPMGADAWIAAAAAPAGLSRVPKGVMINGVRFCFWHAPSRNNGVKVAQMFNGLIAGGDETVLFGDLNCEPETLIARGIPRAQIIAPNSGTRISGRCLDFAITNVPEKFIQCRAIDKTSDGYDIKNYTGSDHMVMVLEMKR